MIQSEQTYFCNNNNNKRFSTTFQKNFRGCRPPSWIEHCVKHRKTTVSQVGACFTLKLISEGAALSKRLIRTEFNETWDRCSIWLPWDPQQFPISYMVIKLVTHLYVLSYCCEERYQTKIIPNRRLVSLLCKRDPTSKDLNYCRSVAVQWQLLNTLCSSNSALVTKLDLLIEHCGWMPREQHLIRRGQPQEKRWSLCW